MAVALLFIDGVGVGPRSPESNPLAREELLLSQFQDGTGAPLPGGGRRVDVDATFEVPGRPQSASNQAALWTGEPAPALLGCHVLGFPNPPLRRLIAERSIVRRLSASGRSTRFANAYPRFYLDALGLPREGPVGPPPGVHVSPAALRRARPSASTLAMAAGGVRLRTLEHAREGLALTHDLDGASGRSRGFELPHRTAEEAAEILWRLGGDGVDLVAFEHYLADEAGHAQDHEAALRALTTFDRFARAVIASRPSAGHVVICSDHGNVEDLSSKNHTRHEVAILYFGPAPGSCSGLATVADVGRLVLRLLKVEP